MDAAIFYPVGIGKHIVCIDADQAAAHKQLVGVNPEPQRKHTGEKYSG